LERSQAGEFCISAADFVALAWALASDGDDPMDEKRTAAMEIAPPGLGGFHEILTRKQDELARFLRKRNDIAIEKSADQVDEIQYALERDVAIQNVDRESTTLRDVRASLRRIDEGSFGNCIECEGEISPKRLAAVPWAQRCIRCEDACDRHGRAGAGIPGVPLGNAA
jgi:DnaK suppressor protein